MDNKNDMFPTTYTWYNDRVKPDAEEPKGCGGSAPCRRRNAAARLDTPKQIYEYLDRYVFKQAEAKKAASILTYNCFVRGIKSNAMFVGPTGCGKTYIWRCLKRAFPNRIEIVDGSNLSLDGWTGSKKWSTLLRSPIFHTGNRTILVIDEADKMLSPKYSRSENVSHSIQSEGLTLMEGTFVDIRDDSFTYQIDTSKICFVFCGAFSAKAHEVAEQTAANRIGFCAAHKEAEAYASPLADADLIEFGVMPEFMGRIQRLVGLEPMTAEDYYQLTDNSDAFLRRISRQYRARIRLTAKMRRELAETACKSGLGIRGMENQIRQLLDDALFEDCSLRSFEF